MTTDFESLKDMGFPEDRAKLALQKSGGLQGALEWLEKHQDMSWEDIQEEETKDASAEPPELAPGDEPRSLVCKDCGKKFRSHAQAEFHASKTEHVNFEESTEEIKPLTEEEKKTRLTELRERLSAKRAVQADEDKAAQKRNEEIRRKATKESQDIKEDLQKKERIKEAEEKRREKLADLEAKKRVQAKIEADKKARRDKAEAEKAARAGLPPPQDLEPPPAPITAPKASSSSSATQARLRLQTPNGSVQKTFPAEATLFEVAHALAEETGMTVTSFTQNFPRKTFDTEDFGMTLKEAGMVPSAALIVR